MPKLEDHPGNQIHPSYVADRQRAALSVAYSVGNEPFRLDGEKRRLWVKMTAAEFKDEQDAGFFRGCARFDVRREAWTSSGILARELKEAAAAPFKHKLTWDGWPADLSERMDGKNGGLDGRGASLQQLNARAFARKLFPGVWFAKARPAGDGTRRAVVDLVPAALVLDWDVTEDDAGQIVTRLVMEGASPDGKIMRTVYQANGSGVEWAEYVTKEGAASCPMRYIYPPESEESLYLDLPESPINAGSYAGVPSVPIVEYQTEWSSPMRSPAPFASAADRLLLVDNLESHLSDHAGRVGASPVFVAKNMGEDENGKPNMLVSFGAVASLPGPDQDAEWRQLGSDHIASEGHRLEVLKAEVERMCHGSIHQRDTSGDIKATQVLVAEDHRTSWLELAMQADVAASERLLRWVSAMEGTGDAAGATITASRVRTPAERAALLDRAERWLAAGVLTVAEFREIAKENAEDITEDLWKRLDALAAQSEDDEDDEPPEEVLE